MVGPGEAVLAAEKVGAPGTQARPPVTLQSHVLPLTSCPFPLRAGRWEEGTGSSQDLWAQLEAGPEHTHCWREAEASEGLVWLLTMAWGYWEKGGLPCASVSSINTVLPGQTCPGGVLSGTSTFSRLLKCLKESFPISSCRHPVPVHVVFTVR